MSEPADETERWSFLMHLSRSWIPIAVLPFLAPPAAAQTLQTRTFEHPLHPVSIEAPADWKVADWPGDPGVFEVGAPDSSVRVLLWFTATEMDALRYLNKMLGMKPLSPIGDPEIRAIDGRQGWQIVATGSEQGDGDVRETLTVIGAGPDAPTEGNYVLQVWCPETHGDSLAPMIESIVGSLRIGPAGG